MALDFHFDLSEVTSHGQNTKFLTWHILCQYICFWGLVVQIWGLLRGQNEKNSAIYELLNPKNIYIDTHHAK